VKTSEDPKNRSLDHTDDAAVVLGVLKVEKFEKHEVEGDEHPPHKLITRHFSKGLIKFVRNGFELFFLVNQFILTTVPEICSKIVTFFTNCAFYCFYYLGG